MSRRVPTGFPYGPLTEDAGAGALGDQGKVVPVAPGEPTTAPSRPATGAAGGATGGRDSAYTSVNGSVHGTVLSSELLSAKIRTAHMTVAVARTESVATQADRAEAIAVGLGGEVHVRVDRVVHPEVLRLDHQVVPTPCQRLVHARLPTIA